MNFKLVSNYKPMGDQPKAIKDLVKALNSYKHHAILKGVTGSGKTFTIANVINKVNRPVLVLCHNKTLAAQLYSEFKGFFPNNLVEYFVSYYDYYQPEAFIPSSNTYIEKDLSINEEIEKLRMSTTSALLSGRRDVIVVSSVSCLYGIGNPDDFHQTSVNIKLGDVVSRKKFLYSLVEALYTRTEKELSGGTFRVNGEVIDIMPAYGETAYRIAFFDDEIEGIYQIDPASGAKLASLENVTIYPANLFVTTKERINSAIAQIQIDLGLQIDFFERMGRTQEAVRIKQRVEYDLEMIKELGYCSGIENYSRYFDGRRPGSRPFCLLDYFPDDYLMVIDESHVTIPQIRAMYGGDASRKENLVEYGYRLAAAKDNRPLKFEEFEAITGQSIYVSATPADYELIKSEGVIAEQVIRPTGILDPIIKVEVTDNQIDRLIEETTTRAKRNERVLITTVTKRLAEELSKYLDKIGIRNRYIHSDVDTLERVKIIEDLRSGSFDVLIGVNLLREGLDLPEVSLVAILDADKEGFLRSARALTQTAGRAARHPNGTVIMFAERRTEAMESVIKESSVRRAIQMKYNQEHQITPKRASTGNRSIISNDEQRNKEQEDLFIYDTPAVQGLMAAESKAQYSTNPEDLDQAIQKLRTLMEDASKQLDFALATKYRDKMYELQALKKEQQQTK